ncbi:DNA-binding protein [Marinicauda salina]|uniref:DNA-binding protein n=2 Tax=Marinicauda salina TaxID=2135793 RepID=A0A2U2BSY4_9PROT|nr:DNA-binding protein [Marinicauda salina]
MPMFTDVTNAMSINQAAAYAGLSRSTIYRLMQRGELQTLKIGSRRLVRKADVDALLERAVDRSK